MITEHKSNQIQALVDNRIHGQARIDLINEIKSNKELKMELALFISFKKR